MNRTSTKVPTTRALPKHTAPAARVVEAPNEREPLTLLTLLAEAGLPISDPEALSSVTIQGSTRPTIADRWWTFATPHGRRYRLSPDGETAERWTKTGWETITLGSQPRLVELFSAALVRERARRWQTERAQRALLAQAEAVIGGEALRALVALGYHAGRADGAGRLFAPADPDTAALIDEVRALTSAV